VGEPGGDCGAGVIPPDRWRRARCDLVAAGWPAISRARRPPR
jgi:hypothetical protein